jgi:hypothetical protein
VYKRLCPLAPVPREIAPTWVSLRKLPPGPILATAEAGGEVDDVTLCACPRRLPFLRCESQPVQTATFRRRPASSSSKETGGSPPRRDFHVESKRSSLHALGQLRVPASRGCWFLLTAVKRLCADVHYLWLELFRTNCAGIGRVGTALDRSLSFFLLPQVLMSRIFTAYVSNMGNRAQSLSGLRRTIHAQSRIPF